MAKVNAPLMSVGASGALAKTMVFFPWKGLNVVRSWVKPANPNTTAQSTQRGYLNTIVAAIHAVMAAAAGAIGAVDTAAYSLLASTKGTPRTWFNQACADNLDSLRAGKNVLIFGAGGTTPGAGSLAVTIQGTTSGANSLTAGNFHWGTSKTALINSTAGVVVAEVATATIPGLAAGVKYYWQFRPTAHADFTMVNSGIYYGTPT